MSASGAACRAGLLRFPEIRPSADQVPAYGCLRSLRNRSSLDISLEGYFPSVDVWEPLAAPLPAGGTFPPPGEVVWIPLKTEMRIVDVQTGEVVEELGEMEDTITVTFEGPSPAPPTAREAS